MDIEQIWAVTISAVVTGVVTYLFALIKEQTKKHNEETQRKEEVLKCLIETNKEILTWRKNTEENIKTLKETVNNIDKHLSLIKNGGMAILRDRSIQSCRVFIEKGQIGLIPRENIREMYKWYHELGGNGIGEMYYKQAMELKVKPSSSEDINAALDLHHMSEQEGEEHGGL